MSETNNRNYRNSLNYNNYGQIMTITQIRFKPSLDSF